MIARCPRDSNKIYGDCQRQRFYEKMEAKGIRLVYINGVLYRTAWREMVGIVAAFEINSRLVSRFAHSIYMTTLIFLCEEEQDGHILEFVLDKAFFKPIEGRLSRSNGGYKLNVILDGGSFFLRYAAGDMGNIDRYLNAYEKLR